MAVGVRRQWVGARRGAEKIVFPEMGAPDPARRGGHGAASCAAKFRELAKRWRERARAAAPGEYLADVDLPPAGESDVEEADGDLPPPAEESDDDDEEADAEPPPPPDVSGLVLS